MPQLLRPLPIFAIVWQLACPGPATAQPAAWTFMVYLNGDNNLEPKAIDDFLEMAQAGSTHSAGRSGVHIVVQLDRHPEFDDRFQERLRTGKSQDWFDTLRFHVTSNMTPTPDQAVCEPFDALGSRPANGDCARREVDMSRGGSLAEFVDWARRKYPAQRYALVIWDHGDGWRVLNTDHRLREASSAARRDSAATVPRGGKELDFDEVTPVKGVSLDMTSGAMMYNRDLQESLAALLRGQKLDLIGFDACLMSMLETMYAVRDVARVFVGSEDNQPGTGWDYGRILRTLTANPSMDAVGLAKVIVDSYAARYQKEPLAVQATTQSAFDLSKIPALAASVDRLAERLLDLMPADANARGVTDLFELIQKAVAETPQRSGYPHVDLDYFASRVMALVTDAPTRDRTREVRDAITNARLTNWFHPDLPIDHQTGGVAVYFKDAGQVDSGYTDANMLFPVQFVKDFRWDNMVQRYLLRVGP